MKSLIWLEYREFCNDPTSAMLGLRESMAPEPSENEDKIARYLEIAPSYSAMGKVVGDVLDPSKKVVLFPGTQTDGVYLWPAVLFYYVRVYHVRIPQEFVNRMASLNWQPPTEDDINWDVLYQSTSAK